MCPCSIPSPSTQAPCVLTRPRLRQDGAPEAGGRAHEGAADCRQDHYHHSAAVHGVKRSAGLNLNLGVPLNISIFRSMAAALILCLCLECFLLCEKASQATGVVLSQAIAALLQGQLELCRVLAEQRTCAIVRGEMTWHLSAQNAPVVLSKPQSKPGSKGIHLRLFQRIMSSLGCDSDSNETALMIHSLIRGKVISIQREQAITHPAEAP